jgi:uncharacterized protein (DUF2384 family)
MLDIQLSPENVPTANVPLLQGLMALVARTAAMGFMASERITSLDAKTIARVVGALQEQKLASRTPLDMAPLMRTDAGDLDPATAKRMEAVVGELVSALGQSPAPSSEWATMREVLGDESLCRLVGVSDTSLRRYASNGRSTPQAVAERLHWLAMVVADLSGAYNTFGIRRWFERPRPQLGGKSPREALGGNWNVDSSVAERVRVLAAALSGAQPLAV